MVRCTLFLTLALGVCGCESPESPGTALASRPAVPGRAHHPFAQFDQNVFHDTLLVQTSFDLGDSTFIMVASNVEDTFEGLRLYRYRFTADSTIEHVAISSPAYDSWTMLPKFFPIDTSAVTDAMWVLANFGEKESWGQKVMLLDWEFMDVGFMDVAVPERVMEDDTLRLKRRDIGPFARYSENGDTAVWRFDQDSVFLYSDQSGGADMVIAAAQIRYTYHVDEGLALWLDGQKRLVKKPA